MLATRRTMGEKLLEAEASINEAEPKVANKSDRQDVVGEKAVQEVGRHPHADASAAPVPFIVRQRRRIAGVESDAGRVDDASAQRVDVVQSEVESLAGERMDDMRCIAEQRQALADEATRHLVADREGGGKSLPA